MVPPMTAALSDRRGPDSPYLRQVVFLTDGEIGNEQELFDTIAAMRGRSRVFMVGIGSAPNSFLMTRAAEIGRGTFTHIGSVDQVQERMRELIEKLESPIVTGLTASYAGGAIDATPDALPDLYRGEPIVIAAKLGAADGQLEIKGMNGARPWTVTVADAGGRGAAAGAGGWGAGAPAQPAGVVLPKTAADAELKIMAGLLLLALSFLLALKRHPHRHTAH